ncbi:MAG: UPF0175 family protein [Nanoarchaeota archaeon]|nr:UPF0175 family protein [Nanoarchaeota archaeon]
MDLKKAVLEDLSAVKRSLLLLLSANSNSPINGRLWYQKELFLISKNNKEVEEEACFEAYLWGPHSELADNTMEELVQIGVVRQEGSRYELTPLGKEIAKEISKKTPKEEQELIEDVKEFFNNLSKDELLMFIYASYPDMVEDAVEFKRLLPHRKEIAISIYRKDKITAGKAAEIADVSIDEMIKELQQRKLYLVEEL